MPIETAVPFKELTDGYQRDGVAFATNSVTRRYQVAWKDRIQFIVDVMGVMINVSGLPVWRAPARDIEHSWLYAATYQEIGVGKSGYNSALKVNTFEFANINVVFKPLSGSDKEGQQSNVWMDIETRIDVEHVTYPQPLKYLIGGALLNNVLASKISPSITMNVMIKNWYSAPIGDGTWETKVGYVNKFPMRILWYYADSQTLMFLGPRVHATYDQFGVRTFDVQLSFKTRATGWNTRLSNKGNWEFVVVGNTGKYPNPEYDLRLLLP